MRLAARFALRTFERTVDTDLLHALLEHIEDANYGEGAILVFLPGWDDISRLRDALSFSTRFRNESKYRILPLHSGVAPRDFLPVGSVRKVPRKGRRSAHAKRTR